MLHLGANEAALWDPAIKTSAKLPELNEIRQIPARVRDERLPPKFSTRSFRTLYTCIEKHAIWTKVVPFVSQTNELYEGRVAL